MKKLLFIAATVGVMVCTNGCSKPDELNISATSLEFPHSGQETSFTVQSNVSWTVSDDAATWLMVSPTSGSNNGRVTVSAAENTATSQRTATITVSGGKKTKTIDVRQVGAPITVSAKTLIFTSSATQKTFSISSNLNWTVESDETWLTVSPTSGSSDGTVTVSADENISTSQRKATITVSGGGIVETINVTQQGAAAYLNVTPDYISLPAYASQTTLTISSNTSWFVQGSTSFTFSPSSGENNGTVTITAPTNPYQTERHYQPIIVSGGGITQSINVSQQRAPLSVSPGSLSFTSTSEQKTFNIYTTNSSDISWTVQSSETWLTVSPITGLNEGTVTVTADDNISSSQRTATITVSGGDVTQTIRVTQAGFVPSLTVNHSLSFSSSYERKTLIISSNTSWTAQSSETWLTVSQSSGEKNATVTVRADDNTSTTQRTATITVSGGGITRTVDVTQAGATDTGSIMFYVTADPGCGYINVTLSGYGTKSITRYYSPYPYFCGETGTATFTDLPVGTYSYTASCGSRSWSGIVTRTASCHRISL